MKEAAVAAFSRRDYAAAVDLLSRAISLDNSNHVFWSNRSAAYVALEEFDSALADADECVRLQPGWAKGHARRGGALFRLGRLGPARAALEKALSLDGETVQARSRLSLL